MSWLSAIAQSAPVAHLAAMIDEGGAVSARGAAGSSTAIVVAALAAVRPRPLLAVFAHLDEADEAIDELSGLGVGAARLPAMEVLPGETGVNLELLTERLTLLARLAAGDAPAVIVAPIPALMQRAPRPDRLSSMLRVLTPGSAVDVPELCRWLDDGGFRRVATIEGAGEYAVRGGIVDVHPAGGEPCRIDLFGDEIESLCAIDLDTMGSDRRLDRVVLVAASAEALRSGEGTVSFADYLPPATAAVLAEVSELTEQGRAYDDRVADARAIDGPPAVFRSIGARCHALLDVNQLSAGASARAVDLAVAPLPTFDERTADAVQELLGLARSARTIVLCQNEGEAERLRELLADARGSDARGAAPAIEVEVRYLHRGFVWGAQGAIDPHPALSPERGIALVPYHEMLHRYQTRRRIRRVAGAAGTRAVDAFVDLQAGDYVVHRDHGIARFVGIRHLADASTRPPSSEGEGISAGEDEFLTLEFARGAKLNVPAAKIHLVQKYIGAFSGTPELSTLGGRRWKGQKEKVAEAVRDLAREMLEIQAARETLPGIRFPADTSWQREFEAEFPYEETDDQLSAIDAVKRDMASERPMDRLVCGDVGFGKTEIAIRAAFKAVEFGKQVAVLVPTTVLAEQHEATFRGRFADYPFRIEAISRFRTKSEQAEVLEALRLGQVDVIIGTHRLLSKDVRFADLGLVVIDEEQRFGVEHKQKLLALRATADVLTLSATPIPRTLHMAMLGLRDISSLTTAPLDRRAIVTEVIAHNPRRIEQAIRRELAREGQVFVVHNRVHDIESVADDVQRLAPGARVVIGHGQMPARTLESVMRTFIRGDADILVCTTIIESGIDIPTANTMIVLGAHMFGLSELHQLRGRVGRYKHRAYCYLVLPKDGTVSEVALQRLTALEQFSMLGAGFRIALRDLEIRGAGNLLGPEQSGHIAAVGYEMYCRILEDAVARLKNEDRTVTADVTIELGVVGAIPRGYIPSDARRMDVYRRIAQAEDPAALAEAREAVRSAYGELPRRAEMLVRLAEVRIAAGRIGIRSITRHEGDVIFRTGDPHRLEERMGRAKGSLRRVGEADAEGVATVYYRPPPAYLEGETLLSVLAARLGAKQEAPVPPGASEAPRERRGRAPSRAP
jgi:transcription-repair coupling factor (superfamily II helicase)